MGTSDQSTIAIRGILRVPEKPVRSASSSACSTSCRAGNGRESHFRIYARIIGSPKKTLNQHIVIRAPAGDLGVVFRESNPAGIRDEERVEPRHRTGVAKAGIDVRQLRFPFGESELRHDRLVRERRVVRFCETRAARWPHASVETDTATATESAGEAPNYNARSPKKKIARAQLCVELRLRIAGDVVGEQLMIFVDAVAQHGLLLATAEEGFACRVRLCRLGPPLVKSNRHVGRNVLDHVPVEIVPASAR